MTETHEAAERAIRDAHLRVAWLCGGCGSQRTSPRHDTRCINCDSAHAAIDRTLALARLEQAEKTVFLHDNNAGMIACGFNDYRNIWIQERDRLRAEVSRG